MRLCEWPNGRFAGATPQAGQSSIFFEWGTEPQFLESYRQTYAMMNPTHVPLMVYSKVGEVNAASDYIPVEELIASRFYQEWLAPQGIIDVAYVIFEKSAVSYVALAIQRNERHGLVDREAKRRLGLLAPHFRRAVAIGQIIDFHKFEAAALADSLDGLTTAMFLVDAHGQIVHRNAAGHAMLEKGKVIRSVAGKFSAVDTQTDHTLRDVFKDAENGDQSTSTKGVDVSFSTPGGERYVAHVLPLTSGARRKTSVAYSAVAAVFVRKAELELLHPLERIASDFRLTPAEMRVLMMVVQFGGARKVTLVLGISEPTVRSHLQHIFKKTGTSRQVDLVKLVAGYMSPLNT